MKPTLFDFNGAAVRVIHNESGIWFVASDVCRVLEIANNRDAVAGLSEDEKGVASTDTPGGSQQVSVINESGLYCLIFKSRKPQAIDFRKWVTSEVLPTIRQTGAYALPGLTPTNRIPENFVEALRLAADAEEQRQALQLQLEEAAPKLEVYERCMSSNTLFDFKQVAALLAEKNLGSTNLVRRLMDMRILYRHQNSTILAYRQFIEAGYFKAVERPYPVRAPGGAETGEIRIGVTLKTTAKGVEFIARKLGTTVLPSEPELIS